MQCSLPLSALLLFLDVYKFPSVKKTHDEYQRELDIANARLKRLQAENEYGPPIFPISCRSKFASHPLPRLPTYSPVSF